jgi:hypothetical protein
MNYISYYLLALFLWAKKISCPHKNTYWLVNIYGDAIILYNGKRSIHKCIYCGKKVFKDRLYGKEHA